MNAVTGTLQGADHAVVIGAGFGGLAAAVRLRARGYRVTVLEANEQAGGRASVFRKDGFTFDAGPTVITAPFLVDELFTLLGRSPRDFVEMLPVDPFYRVLFPDGSRFDYVGDEERILSQIEAMSPRDVDGYRRMAVHAREIFDVGFSELADRPFHGPLDMLKIAPDLVRLQGWRTLHGLVSRYIEDERLRQVFSFQPLLIGGNPFTTPALYLLIHWLERKWGVCFPKGGTGALVAALVRLLNDVDVEVRTNAPVARIDVERGRARAVHLEDGSRIACDLVVANGDPTTIYGRLIDPAQRPRHSDGKLARVRQSMSLFVTYFGTNRTYDDIAHHTIVLGKRYRELLDDIFRKRILADDFSLYLHRPGATDTSLAPKGQDGFYVLSPVPNLKGNVDWASMAPEYEQRILTALDQSVLPGVLAHTTTRFSIDPRTFAGRLRSADGAAFGPEPLLTQSAAFRFHNRSDDVDGLYFVGAGTHPGAGVPGVLSSARVLDKIGPNPTRALAVPSAAETRARAMRGDKSAA
jgi:phytoene desaturase